MKIRKAVLRDAKGVSKVQVDWLNLILNCCSFTQWGFFMNSQELETANRIGLVFIVTIFNDKRYSLIEKHQRNANFEVTQVTFSNPDFELYARSFGIGYRRASNVDSFQLAVREAIDSSELNLLEVVLEEKDI